MKIVIKKTLTLPKHKLNEFKNVIDLLNKIATELKDDYLVTTNGFVIFPSEIFDAVHSIQKIYDLAEEE